MTRLQWWILGAVAVVAALVVFVVFLANSYVPLRPLPTTTPIIVSPTPSATMTAVTPRPTPTSVTTPSETVTASATTSPSSTPSPSSTVPTCTPGVPGIYKELGQCNVPGMTQAQVLDACRAAALDSMWRQSNHKAGKPMSDQDREADSFACIRGFGLVKFTGPPPVQGCPDGCALKGRDATYTGLQWILLTGKLKGGSVDLFVFDAATGRIKDSEATKQAIINWNDQFQLNE